MAAKPVFIVGMQRSGTNYLFWNIEADKSVEAYNEDNPEAFNAPKNYLLKSLHNTEQLINRSAAEVILFKSITNIIRADTLLSFPNSKIIWIMRDVNWVINSHEKEFGEKGFLSVERALNNVVLGGNRFFYDPDNEWPSRLSDKIIQSKIKDYLGWYLKICENKYDTMGLFWAFVNNMYFMLDFDKSSQVKVVFYEELVENPDKVFKEIGDFCGLYEFVYSIKPRKPKRDNPNLINSGVRMLCDLVRMSIEKTETLKWNAG